MARQGNRLNATEVLNSVNTNSGIKALEQWQCHKKKKKKSTVTKEENRRSGTKSMKYTTLIKVVWKKRKNGQRTTKLIIMTSECYRKNKPQNRLIYLKGKRSSYLPSSISTIFLFLSSFSQVAITVISFPCALLFFPCFLGFLFES